MEILKYYPDICLVMIQYELKLRLRELPNYSLRLFALDLEVDPSYLSKVLARKKSLSVSLFSRFLNLIEFDLSDLESLAPKRGTKDLFYSKSVDSAHLEHRWYHQALFSLVEHKDFFFDAEWISKHLCISPHLATKAMQECMEMGILTKNKQGRVIKKYKRYKLNRNSLNPDLDTHFSQVHEDLLLKSIGALKSVYQENRLHDSFVFQMSNENIEMANEIIQVFMRGFYLALKHSGRSKLTEAKSNSYAMQFSLFPLSQID